MRTVIRISLYLTVIISFNVHAQNPVIYSIDRSYAAAREIVTIHGSDFGTDPADVSVFFGGTKAQIKSISNQILEVRTPAAATFDPIRIVNTSTGRSASAPGQFFVNYKGEGGITADKFSPQSDFQAESGLYDLCLCDFDGDSKVDIATASNNANMITVFRNTSSPGNIALTGQSVLINARTLHAKCGDLNGDGRPDIVLSEGSDGARVFVLTNNGGFSFTMQIITLATLKLKQVEISDLDLDGRPDIVVTNTGGNEIRVLPNTSAGPITFGTPINIFIPEASSTDGLAVADLDADGYPEIVTSHHQTDNGNKLYILKNQGGFDFSDISVIAVNKAISNVRIADVDADAKPDIVAAKLTGNEISIYLNNTSSALSFKDPVLFPTDTRPVGLDFSDFDGDGKLDIAVSALAKSVTVLNSTTAGTGSASFASALKLNATYINRHLKSADMDGDGKPDIVFTSVDDFSGIPIPASRISVLRNLSCMVPEITPAGPIDICTGSSLQLTATYGGGTTYQWFKQGTGNEQQSGPEEFFEVTTPGIYKVVALSGPPACSKESAVVEVSFTAPTVTLSPDDPDARSNGPVCSDNVLRLQVNDVGATAYRWRGPGGFSQSVTTPILERPSFASDHAGLYIVELLAGGCVAKTDSTLVEAITIPEFTVGYTGIGQFCSNTSKTLTVTPFFASGFTYQWHERATGSIPEASFENFVAEDAGEYYVVVTPDHAGCVPKETSAVQITEVALPTAEFHAAENGCAGDDVAFVQKSSGAPDMDLVYVWAFGDGKTSGTAAPSNIFETPGTYEVLLKVSYPGLEACNATATRSIEILSVAIPEITATDLAMCEGDDVSLSVSGSFSEITWSTAETETAITVTSPGTYDVTTVDLHGCSASNEITIGAKTVPNVSATADRQLIASGQAAHLTAEGADTYVWSPGKTLNDSTIASPLASPVTTTTYTVKGSLADGCTATATIAIQVSGEVVNIVVPVLFSPNGDNANEMLIIGGVENYPDCSLSVFDKRGGRVYGTTGYQNTWDGTFNGTPLPEGVYYYVFGCPNSKAMTGTVTIIR